MTELFLSQRPATEIAKELGITEQRLSDNWKRLRRTGIVPVGIHRSVISQAQKDTILANLAYSETHSARFLPGFKTYHQKAEPLRQREEKISEWNEEFGGPTTGKRDRLLERLFQVHKEKAPVD